VRAGRSVQQTGGPVGRHRTPTSGSSACGGGRRTPSARAGAQVGTSRSACPRYGAVLGGVKPRARSPTSGRPGTPNPQVCPAPPRSPGIDTRTTAPDRGRLRPLPVDNLLTGNGVRALPSRDDHAPQTGFTARQPGPDRALTCTDGCSTAAFTPVDERVDAPLSGGTEHEGTHDRSGRRRTGSRGDMGTGPGLAR